MYNSAESGATGSAIAVRQIVFGPGVGSFQFANVNCNGSEGNFLNCTSQSGEADHLQDAGVECGGRPLRELYTNTCHAVSRSTLILLLCVHEGEIG